MEVNKNNKTYWLNKVVVANKCGCVVFVRKACSSEHFAHAVTLIKCLLRKSHTISLNLKSKKKVEK